MPETPAPAPRGYWTDERKAEFEAACDLRQLHRDNPMPGPLSFASVAKVVRHALVQFASEPGGELACDAELAATTAVEALQGAYLLHNVARRQS